MAIIHTIILEQHIYDIILPENNLQNIFHFVWYGLLFRNPALKYYFYFDENVGDFTNIFSVAKNKAADINLFAYKIKFIAVA